MALRRPRSKYDSPANPVPDPADYETLNIARLHFHLDDGVTLSFAMEKDNPTHLISETDAFFFVMCGEGNKTTIYKRCLRHIDEYPETIRRVYKPKV